MKRIGFNFTRGSATSGGWAYGLREGALPSGNGTMPPMRYTPREWEWPMKGLPRSSATSLVGCGVRATLANALDFGRGAVPRPLGVGLDLSPTTMTGVYRSVNGDGDFRMLNDADWMLSAIEMGYGHEERHVQVW